MLQPGGNVPKDSGVTTVPKVVDLTRAETLGDLRAVHVEAARLLVELDRDLGRESDPRVLELAAAADSRPASARTSSVSSQQE